MRHGSVVALLMLVGCGGVEEQAVMSEAQEVHGNGRVVCAQIYRPVCGADGKTWSNACELRANGVGLAHQGPCENPCATNDDCAALQFCDKPAGGCDGPGICRLRGI